MQFKNKLKKLILLICIPTACNDIFDADYSDIFDDPTGTDEMQKALCASTITPNFKPSDALDLLINNPAVDFLGILSKNFYLRTNRIPKRDLNTLPIFTLFHNLYDDYCKVFNLIPFVNQTTHQYFYGNCPFIKAYIAIDDPDIINKLAALNDLGIFDKNIPDFIALFKGARMEERRAGIMFQFLKNWRKTSLEFKLPFLYQERNFNFTEEEIVDIKQSDFFENSANNKVEEKEIKKHIVADLVGLGDLRLRLTSLIFNNYARKLRVGAELNIPTAFAFKRGLIGGNFSHNCETPCFYLYGFIDDILNTDAAKKAHAVAMALNFGLKAADRLSAMTLQTELGENKHVILGLIVEPEIILSKYLKINSLFNISYIFPKKENRYYLRFKNPADFNKAKYEKDLEPCKNNLPECNQNKIAQDLIFFQNQIINTFFPVCVNTIVSPGFTLQYTLVSTIEAHDWQGMSGIDFYYKQRESLQPLNVSPALFYNCIAITNYYWQTKAFLRLLRTLPKKRFDFTVGLSGDITFASRNIGKDFSIALDLNFNF